MTWMSKRIAGIYAYRSGGSRYPAYVRFVNNGEAPYGHWVQILGDNREDTTGILAILVQARSDNRTVRVDIKGGFHDQYLVYGVYS